MNASSHAEQELIDLRIDGMTCAACAARIEKTLNRLPGVSASVNLATEQARVRVASGQRVQPLIEAVEHDGYGAEVMSRPDPAADKARREAQYRRERRLFWLAAGLSLPLAAQMVWMLNGDHADVLPRWLQLVLATPVQLWIGRRFYIGAWHALRGGSANMDV